MHNSGDLDDVFNNKMEKHPLNDDDKENRTKTRRDRTKKEQFDLILEFYKQNNEELLDSDTFNQLWNELVVKLNSIGPPNLTNSKWKRVWSEHKYNKKRKRVDAVAEEGQSSNPIKKVKLNEQSQLIQNQPYQPLEDMAPDVMLPDVNQQLSVLIQQASVRPLSEFLVQNISMLTDLNDGYSNNPFSPSLIDDQLVTRPDVLTRCDEKISAVNSALYNVEPFSSNQPLVSDGSYHGVSISDRQNQLHSIDSQKEIGKKLSEIIKKLDILIDNQVVSNNLLNELVKNKYY